MYPLEPHYIYKFHDNLCTYLGYMEAFDMAVNEANRYARLNIAAFVVNSWGGTVYRNELMPV